MILKLFFVFFMFFIKASRGEIIYNLPDEIELRDANSGIMKKTSNRYKDIDQIENQYKGKLKYKPTNNAIRNFREGRFFTSASYLINKNKFNKLAHGKDEYDILKDKQSNGYDLVFGYYFNDNMALSLEYFDYKNKEMLEITPWVVKDTSTPINRFNAQIRNYFLNFSVESNYGRVIPVFGLGVGVMNGEIQFNSTTEMNNTDFDLTPIYQCFLGFDFALTDNILLVARYKYLDMVADSKFEVDNIKYKLELDTGSMVSVGVKFFWN